MELINGWRQAWRLWSVRLSALGALLTGWALLAPDAMLQAWQALPNDLRAMVPTKIADAIPTILFVATIVARLIPQPKAVAAVETSSGTQ
jgi:hypothetical protein